MKNTAAVNLKTQKSHWTQLRTKLFLWHIPKIGVHCRFIFRMFCS